MRLTESCWESRMISRTSRGVPEWSGGKELYMGSLVLVTGKISHYRYCTGSAERGPGVHRGGPPAPGGHMGCRGCALAYMGQGHQPQEAHAPGETLKEESQQGKAPPRCLGEDGLLPSRPLPWRKVQGCAPPPSPFPLYIVEGREGSRT